MMMFPRPCLALAAVFFLASACGKKSSSDGDGGAGGAPVSTGGASRGVAPIVGLSGQPAAVSNAKTLNVTVTAGTGGVPVSYKYAILSDAKTCDGATYSASIDIGTPITASTGADGAKMLCVIGRNASGGDQVSATTYAWTLDTAAPTATLSGQPADPAADKALKVQVGGGSDDTASYKFAVTSGATTCAGATYGDWTPVATSLTQELGGDGKYALCVLGRDQAGNEQSTATLYTWTKDSTAPVLTVEYAPTGFGPATTAGDSTTLSGSATDATTSVKTVEVSVQRGSGGCLSNGKDTFGAACPNWQAATLTGSTWSFSAPDVVFSDGYTYTYSVRGTDAAGNTSTPVTKALLWDSVPPAAPYALSVEPAAEKLLLTWTAVDDAAGYIVVRAADTTVTAAPSSGSIYAAGSTLADGQTVVYVGKDTSITDDGLTPDVTYSYAVYSYDTANNYSTKAATGKETARARFRGLAYAYPAGPGRLVGVLWQLLDDGVNSIKDYVYNFYSAASSGGQDFTVAPAGTATGGSGLSVFTASGSGTASAYVVARTALNATATDSNTRERTINFGAGRMHKIIGHKRYNGMPSMQSIIALPTSVAIDSWGNTLFIANTSMAYVRCDEVTQAPYCRGRSTDQVYTLLGAPEVSDSADGASPADPAGNLSALTVDKYGNVFVFDNSYYRLRVLCNYTGTNGGFCAGKTNGNIYRVAGTGSGGLPTTNSKASTSALGNVSSLAVDATGNIFMSERSYQQVYAVCNSAAGAYCTGKTAGNIYIVAGTGATPSDTTGVATAVGIGDPMALTLDSYGNIYIADASAYRARVICVATSGSYCGRANITAGNLYTVAGTGASSADGADGGSATATALGTPGGIAVDSFGNVYVADYAFHRVRAICLSASATRGACQGKTKDYAYWAAGTGAANIGDADGNATDIDLYAPLTLTADSADNIYVADYGNYRLRAICYNGVGANNYCAGRSPGQMYRLVGAGQAITAQTGTVDAGSVIFKSLRGMALDSLGNLYYVDAGLRRVFVVCFKTTSGFCSGKTAGYRYKLAGSGALGTAADNGTDAYLTAKFAGLTAIALDAWDNVYLAEGEYDGGTSNHRVRALCVNDVSHGFCNGRTLGRLYTVAGDGNTNNTADGATAASASAPAPLALAVDTYGNVYYYSNYSSNYKIRVVCVDATENAANPCRASGPDGQASNADDRAVGKTWAVAGTGNSGTPSDGTAGPSSAIPAYNFGMTIDGYNNLFFGSFSQINVLCNTTSGGFCAPKSRAYIYNLSGVANSGSDISDGATINGGSDYHYYPTSIAFDAYGNLLFSNYTRRLGIICFNTSGGFCAAGGRAANKTYRLLGSGGFTNQDGPSNVAISTSYGIYDPTSGGIANNLTINRTTNDLFFGEPGNYAIRWITPP